MNGERFGPYELRSLLGRGGMGEVHRAVDLRKNRGVVALKRLPAGLAGDADFHRRFLREAELAARLRDPHVIPIHDYGEIDGHPYLDMRLVEGVDLAAHLGQTGPLPAGTAVNLVSQVAGALDAAHREGLVHRDVKPQNMLLDGSTRDDDRGPGFVYLIDFGIAANVMSSRLSSSVVTGTCAYMAPERFSASGGDHRVDVYALGCVLYELLTGRLPFTGDFAQLMHAHTYTTPPPPSRWAPDLPTGLDEVVAVALAKSPDHRHASTGALAAAARRALASPRGAALPDTQPGRTTPAGTVPAAGGPTARDPNPPTPRPVPAPARMPAPMPAQRPAQQAAPPAAPHAAPMPATLRATTADPPPTGAAPPPVRPGRRRGWLVAAGVVVAAVILGAASLLLTRSPDAPRASSPEASSPEASSTETAAPPSGPTSQQNLTVSGSASGLLSEATMQCPTEGGTMWSLAGLLDGRKLDVNVTFSQGAPGAGTHPLDTGLDPGHAIVTADLDGGSFATDSGGVNGGSFVVDPGARTGSLEAELAGATGNLHFSGSWSCTSG